MAFQTRLLFIRILALTFAIAVLSSPSSPSSAVSNTAINPRSGQLSTFLNSSLPFLSDPDRESAPRTLTLRTADGHFLTFIQISPHGTPFSAWEVLLHILDAQKHFYDRLRQSYTFHAFGPAFAADGRYTYISRGITLEMQQVRSHIVGTDEVMALLSALGHFLRRYASGNLRIDYGKEERYKEAEVLDVDHLRVSLFRTGSSSA